MNQVILWLLVGLMMVEGATTAAPLDDATNTTVTTTITSTQSTTSEPSITLASLPPILILYIFVAAVLLPIFAFALRDAFKADSTIKKTEMAWFEIARREGKA